MRTFTTLHVACIPYATNCPLEPQQMSFHRSLSACKREVSQVQSQQKVKPLRHQKSKAGCFTYVWNILTLSSVLARSSPPCTVRLLVRHRCATWELPIPEPPSDKCWVSITVNERSTPMRYVLTTRVNSKTLQTRRLVKPCIEIEFTS